VGFGVGRESDLTAFAGEAEGIVVGSALLEEVARGSDAASREAGLRSLVRALRARLHDLAPR
jgi:tryptophan synthase alpha subunit